MGSGLIRTFLIFTDLPVHIEFRSQPMPLVPEGTLIDFDLTLTNPADRKRKRRVLGTYCVSARRLKYSSDLGLNQYIELSPEGE